VRPKSPWAPTPRTGAHKENLGAHDGIEGAALSGWPESSEGRLLQ
jgi:hypothetical protein